MNNVGQLIRDANPIQGDPSVLADDELDALLLLAQTRSGTVDSQDLTKTGEPEKKQRSGWLVAAAAFALVIAVGLTAALLSNRSTDGEPATIVAPTTTAAPTTTVAPTTTAAPATTATAAPAPAVPRRLYEFEPFADGTFRVDELSVPVTFTVTGEWHTQPFLPGFFVITAVDSRGPGHDEIVGIGPTQLFDAATGELLPDGDDLAGWLESVPATATISEATVGEIDGFPTTVFTVEAGDEVVHFSFVDGEFDKRFVSGFIHEVHWVEHSDGPIAFVIGTRSDDLAWLDTARTVLETIEFG